uniref:Tc1-like transposase DDE domain-containing protein n=1 Tax=Monopterus albus TaxID=43700 RepID=A0A3Q3IE99_MONAL
MRSRKRLKKRMVAAQPNKLHGSTVKHGWGNLLIWRCMSTNGVGELYCTSSIINLQMYYNLNLLSLHTLGHQHFQHDNDSRHSSKVTAAFLRKNKVEVLQWPIISPNLRLTECVWGILKKRK